MRETEVRQCEKKIASQCRFRRALHLSGLRKIMHVYGRTFVASAI